MVYLAAEMLVLVEPTNDWWVTLTPDETDETDELVSLGVGMVLEDVLWCLVVAVPCQRHPAQVPREVRGRNESTPADDTDRSRGHVLARSVQVDARDWSTGFGVIPGERRREQP